MEKEYSGHFDKALNTLINNTKCDLSKTDEVNARTRTNEKQAEIAMKILESSKKSVRLLKDTEEIAVATSRELHSQSEQLVKTQKSLEALNSSLKNNQQLINQIKSPFGFVKNFVRNKQESLRSWKNKKPVVKIKDPNTSKSSSNETNLEDSCSHKPSCILDLKVSNNQMKSKHFSNFNDLEKTLDDDLDEISCSVVRLKNLALEMGNEIDMQNENLDQIINKTDKVSGILQKQNKTVTKMM